MENSKEPGKEKVSEEDLGTVSGGCGGGKPDPHKDRHHITRMVCNNCEYVIWYRGNWYRDGKYRCPQCGKIELEGIKIKSKDWR